MEEERKVVAWFTVNGRHIPIYEGQTKDDAWKEFQIKWNKKEQERMEAEHRDKPKKLFLPDILAEDANKDPRGILDKITGKRYKFKKGTKIKHIIVFAGAGTSTEFRNASLFASKYHGKPEDWQHCLGYGYVVKNGVAKYSEVHWYQHKDGNVTEAFIKVRH